MVMSATAKAVYDWDTLPWNQFERSVFKLQKRIYRAAQREDRSAVHKLQRLLLKSKAAVFVSVRRVTQINKGKKTAGIDGLSSLSKKQRLKLAQKILKNPLLAKAKPVRRVWIPKPGKTEKRPLGIPVIEDRARQALVKLAMEPEWEAKFEPNSYGFRPGRSCHDAIQAIFSAIQQAQKYVLDADIAKCFDRINHKALLDKLETFPALRRVIKAWLKAGIMDGEELFAVDEGTPQGGIISPLLANIALHGLEKTIQTAFPHFKPPRSQKPNIRWKPQVIRYADDFVIIHPDLKAITRAKEIAEQWLSGMGLELKPSKTRITHTLKAMDGAEPGFDFLGFSIRQYPRGKYRCTVNGMRELTGFTPSVRPSKEAQKRFLSKTREIIHRNRNAPQAALIAKLNPVIRGWGNYYSKVVSKDVFHRLDHLLFWKLWGWALRRHNNKGRRWIARRYWSHGWTFGERGVATLFKMSSIPIVRHVKVKGNKSPFDGDAVYWSIKTGHYPTLRRSHSLYLKTQKGRCACCGLYFYPEQDMVGVQMHTGLELKWVLVHGHCREAARNSSIRDKYCSVEEPYEGKPSRTVLKTSRSREAPA